MGKLFSDREIRGVIYLLPLAGLFVVGALLVRPATDPAAAADIERRLEERTDSVVPAPFDPNTVDYETLRQLGLTKREAVSLLKYRAAGKVFRIPEDVALCYGFSDSLYRRLAPYIRIGRAYAFERRSDADSAGRGRQGKMRTEPLRLPLEPFGIDTVGVAWLRATGIFTKRQAEAFVRWRNLAGLRDMEEVRELRYVSDSAACIFARYALFPAREPDRTVEPLELNRADSAALRAVYGIGEKTVTAILAYRERLGGFHRVEQLAEVPGVTEANYEKILQQICCDSCEIRKIDINFAAPNELRGHPYLPPRTLRKLLKTRQLKGGWSTLGEMIDDRILTAEEAARLAPYLRFGVRNDENTFR